MSDVAPGPAKPTARTASGKKPTVFIFITVLLDVVGLGIIIPVLPQLITEVSGTPGAPIVTLSDAAIIGGWLMFAYAFMQFFAAPFLGNVSDAVGRRPVLLVGIAMLAVDYLIMAVAPTLVWLFIGRTLSGLAAATFATAFAYLADVSTKDGRAASFGLVGAAFGVGFVIGPALGGLLGSIDVRWPFFAAAALCVANFLFGLFVLPESLPPENRRPFDIKRANPVGTVVSLWPVKSVILLLLAYGCLELALQVYPAVWAYFTPLRFGWSTVEVGLSLAFFGVLIAIGEGLILRLGIKVGGPHLVMLAATGVQIVSLILFAIIASPVWLYAVMVISGISGIGTTALQAMASSSVDETRQGEVNASVTAMKSMVFFIAPPLMTGLFAVFTQPDTNVPYLPGAPFLFAALIACLSFWPYARARASLPGEASPGSAGV
ncbi:MAG: MFS transporter [Pseudomonadota bacterium]